MNGSYYHNSSFNPLLDSRPTASPFEEAGNELPMEQSYIENILRMNKGKTITAYFSYSDSVEWRDRKFFGIIEQAGKDHLIMSNPNDGKWYLLPMIYLDYVEFNDKIIYKL